MARKPLFKKKKIGNPTFMSDILFYNFFEGKNDENVQNSFWKHQELHIQPKLFDPTSTKWIIQLKITLTAKLIKKKMLKEKYQIC